MFLFWLLTFLCNQTVCLFFSVRVMVCVEGVNISDSEDEDESRYKFQIQCEYVESISCCALRFLSDHSLLLISSLLKKKKRKKQPFNHFFVRSFKKLWSMSQGPAGHCKICSIVSHSSLFYFSSFTWYKWVVIITVQIFVSPFFSTSHFLMPIVQEKFPFIHKSSRTLVRYTYTKKLSNLLKNNFYSTSWTLWCLDWRCCIVSSTGVLCPQPFKSDCVHTIN